MGENCCQAKSEDLKALAKKQSKALWIVLVINGIMFFVELLSGLHAGSTALMGDSLDMLGDALAYGSSLFVINAGMKAKAKASIFKAVLMAVLGIIILGKVIYKTFFALTPSYEIISFIGLSALIANVVCLVILTKHKEDDINFRSVWICSRNDIFANSSVIIAGVLIYFVRESWPDLVVGMGITVLFLNSSFGIFKDSFALLKQEE